MKPKVYPVGSTWEAVEGDTFFRVFLFKASGNYPFKRHEVWFAHIESTNGVLHDDWYPHRSSAVREARSWMNNKSTRLVRAKEYNPIAMTV